MATHTVLAKIALKMTGSALLIGMLNLMMSRFQHQIKVITTHYPMEAKIIYPKLSSIHTQLLTILRV